MLILLTKDFVLHVVSEDKMSLNVEQTHDRRERLVATLHTAAAQNDSQVCHEAETLNIDDEVLRERMENPLLFMTTATC